MAKMDIFEAEDTFYLWAKLSRLAKFLCHAKLYEMSLDLPGHFLEAGVYRGASYARFRKLGHLLHPDHNRKFIGFDVFGQFPGTSHEPDKPYLKEQIESDGEISIPRAEMMRLLDEQWLGDNVELVEGDLYETLPELLASRQEMSFAIVDFDLDLYEPTKVAIETLFPRVTRGGIILFDDDLAANRRPKRLRKFPFAMSPCYLIKE